MPIAPAGIEVSVVIPWRGPVTFLRKLVQSLSRQDFRGEWEVVIVDNGSSEDAAAALLEVPELNLRLVAATDKLGPGYARNAGARASSGSKLLFIDSDDEVSENYVRDMADALDKFSFVAPRMDSSALNPAWSVRAYGNWQVDGPQVWPGFLPYAGGHVAIRRDVFEGVGGWPEEFGTAQDVAFAWQVQLSGVPLHFEPKAVSRIRHRRTLRAIFKQYRNWGRSQPLLYKRFRSSGMLGRSRQTTVNDWKWGLKDLLKARSRADVAAALSYLGLSVGRLIGSIRYRTLYL
jgi:glycosyltransferase involved in cell wall biosynthesis